MTGKSGDLLSQIHSRIITNKTTANDLVVLYERAISGDFIPEYIEKELNKQTEEIEIKREVSSTPPDQSKGWMRVLDKIGLNKVDNKLSKRSNTADMIIKKKKEDTKHGSASSITPRVSWLK